MFATIVNTLIVKEEYQKLEIELAEKKINELKAKQNSKKKP